jgi:SAM-dependent methyltransferase
LPFDNATVDLIVSNLGINNFDNPAEVFKECARVLKSGGQLAITTNLKGHWQEFYDVFAETLKQLDKTDILPALDAHVEHRGSVDSISTMFTDAGLMPRRHFEEKFEMRFLGGTALLNHSFVKLGWLGSWKDMIPGSDQRMFFNRLEENLNRYAADNGGLSLTVPMAYIEGIKQ